MYANRLNSKGVRLQLSAVDANSTKELDNVKLDMHPTWFGSKRTNIFRCIPCLHTVLLGSKRTKSSIIMNLWMKTEDFCNIFPLYTHGCNMPHYKDEHRNGKHLDVKCLENTENMHI